MRQWNLDTQIICNKHLRGEHVEHHMFVGSIMKGKRVDNYMLKGLLLPSKLKRRHDFLEREMESRGDNPNSPITFNQLSLVFKTLQRMYKEDGEEETNTLIKIDEIERKYCKFDKLSSLIDLLMRCDGCRKKFEENIFHNFNVDNITTFYSHLHEYVSRISDPGVYIYRMSCDRLHAGALRSWQNFFTFTINPFCISSDKMYDIIDKTYERDTILTGNSYNELNLTIAYCLRILTFLTLFIFILRYAEEGNNPTRFFRKLNYNSDIYIDIAELMFEFHHSFVNIYHGKHSPEMLKKLYNKWDEIQIPLFMKKFYQLPTIQKIIKPLIHQKQKELTILKGEYGYFPLPILTVDGHIILGDVSEYIFSNNEVTGNGELL